MNVRTTRIILILIMLVFLLKGVFLAAIHPIFDGQDEARHYSTVQYINEPKEKNGEINKMEKERDKNDFETYGFSEEVKKTATAANVDILRTHSFNTINFSQKYQGKNEEKIDFNPWEPINYSINPEVVGGNKLYHKLAAVIENFFSNQSILVRFFSIRVFSVILGTLAVLFAYLIAKNAGFEKKHALILAAIASFQPKFSDYFTNINYDVLLIPMFFLFTLGGVLALKNGLGWKNISIMLFSATAAYLTKGTGVILFAVFAFMLLHFFYRKIKKQYPRFVRPFYGFSTLILVVLFVFFKKYLPLGDGIPAALSSLWEYLGKSLTPGRFALSARTYWGTLGWTDSWILSNAIDIIWFVQAFSAVGIFLYFLNKKKPDWLPEKKYVVFFLVMITVLQIGIRAFDWNVFNYTGSLDLGTPGRYFLPNLASHIIVVFTGLGMLIHVFGKEKYFKTVLASGLVLMFSLSIYLIFDVIIYRFYL